LNIGIPTFDSIPVGKRLLLGLVQAVSVRFAGFQCIKISALAPAQQYVLLHELDGPPLLDKFVHHQCALLGDDVYRELPDHDEVGRRVCSARYGRTNLGVSIRSTNVYEERALGILEDDENDATENEADESETDSRVSIWGRYLGRHLRRQLSYGTRTLTFQLAYVYKTMAVTDMWWLALALFLICIAELRYLSHLAISDEDGRAV
jgi:Trk-type K+ transport system membrane component